MNQLIVACDPGLRSGACGVIDIHGKFISSFDIPSEGDRINVRPFKLLMGLYIPLGTWVDFVVEDVHSMPGQGLVSTFRFGRATGAIEAVCELFPNSAMHFVSPRQWKKEMGLSSDKQQSIDMARSLWPDAKLYLKRHHGQGEALLMAEWFRRSL